MNKEERLEYIGSGETAYSRQDAEELRNDLITLRDEALRLGAIDMAVKLSHAIAFMARAIEEIWNPRGEANDH
jgi:hypothetical protein